MPIIALIFINIPLGVIGQFFIKQAINHIGPYSSMPLLTFLYKAFTSPMVILGLFLYLLSAALWVMILSKVDLSFAYPLLSIGYLLVLFVSWAFLHETISPVRLVGVVLIMLGVIFVFRS